MNHSERSSKFLELIVDDGMTLVSMKEIGRNWITHA